jgi:hypothetical protein
MSIAQKYALIQIFTIPTNEADPDLDTHDVKNTAPVSDREKEINSVVQYFHDLGVSINSIELFLKKPIDSISDSDRSALKVLAAELKAGKTMKSIMEERSAKSKIEGM